jgi:hypothetical protein
MALSSRTVLFASDKANKCGAKFRIVSKPVWEIVELVIESIVILLQCMNSEATLSVIFSPDGIVNTSRLGHCCNND